MACSVDHLPLLTTIHAIDFLSGGVEVMKLEG